MKIQLLEAEICQKWVVLTLQMNDSWVIESLMTQIWQMSSKLSYKVCFAEIEKVEAKLCPIFDNVEEKQEINSLKTCEAKKIFLDRKGITQSYDLQT